MKAGARRVFWMPIRASAWLLGIHYIAIAILLSLEFLLRVKISNDEMLRMRMAETVLMLAITFGYGFVRGQGYWPKFGSAYGKWLLTTPWTPGQPLPLGPVLLVWEDIIPLCAGWWLGMDPFYLPIVFGLGYSLSIFATAVFSRSRVAGIHGLMAGFILPGAALAWDRPVISLPLIVGVTVLSQFAARAALQFLPWKQSVAAMNQHKSGLRKGSDWPIAPAIIRSPIPQSVGWLIALLVGWWTFAGVSICMLIYPETDRGAIATSTGAILATLGFLRWLIYCSSCRPPISLWGRLFTLRFVIPGYDYVLLAPLFTIVLAITLQAGLYAITLGPAASCATSTTLVLAAVLNLGPSLRSWQLTGHHRTMVRPQMSRRTDALAN